MAESNNMQQRSYPFLFRPNKSSRQNAEANIGLSLIQQETEKLLELRQKKLERERKKDGKNVTSQYVTEAEKGDNADYDIDKIVAELENKGGEGSSESSPTPSSGGKKKSNKKKGKK